MTDLVSKCDQIFSFQRIWSHLLEKCLMEDFIFCAVNVLFHSSKNIRKPLVFPGKLKGSTEKTWVKFVL